MVNTGDRVFKIGNDVELVDAEKNAIGVNGNRLQTEELNSIEFNVLGEILTQLKIMNYHLCFLTGLEVTEDDVE